jgi:hypothetical protein
MLFPLLRFSVCNAAKRKETAGGVAVVPVGVVDALGALSGIWYRLVGKTDRCVDVGTGKRLPAGEPWSSLLALLDRPFRSSADGRRQGIFKRRRCA